MLELCRALPDVVLLDIVDLEVQFELCKFMWHICC